MVDPTGLCSVGPVRIGFLSNGDDSCRGAGVVSNGLVQAAFVGTACTFTGGLGCFAANWIVVGINASNRYDACEGFSSDFLMETTFDAGAALVNMQSLRQANGVVQGLTRSGALAPLTTEVVNGAGMPASLVIRDYLAPNIARAVGATGLSRFSAWLWDQR